MGYGVIYYGKGAQATQGPGEGTQDTQGTQAHKVLGVPQLGVLSLKSW